MIDQGGGGGREWTGVGRGPREARGGGIVRGANRVMPKGERKAGEEVLFDYGDDY